MADDTDDPPPPDLEDVLRENDWQRKVSWFPPEEKRKTKPTRQAAYATRKRDEKKSSEHQTQLQVWAPEHKPTRAAIAKAAEAIAANPASSDVMLGVIDHAEIHEFLASLLDALGHENLRPNLLTTLQAIVDDDRLRQLVLDLLERKADLDNQAPDAFWILLAHLSRDPALRALCTALMDTPRLRALVETLVADSVMRRRVAKTVAPGPGRDFFVGAWAAPTQTQKDLIKALARPDALKLAVRISERPDIAKAAATAEQYPQAPVLGLRILQRRGPAGWLLRRLVGTPH